MKRAIPKTPTGLDAASRMMLDSIKENIESITGVRGGRIKELPATASAVDVIDKINEIIARLQ